MPEYIGYRDTCEEAITPIVSEVLLRADVFIKMIFKMLNSIFVGIIHYKKFQLHGSSNPKVGYMYNNVIRLISLPINALQFQPTGHDYSVPAIP